MRGGRLDRRISVLVRTQTQGDAGEVVETWPEERRVWAEVVPLGGNERFAAATTQATRAAKVRIRYSGAWRPDVATHRLEHDGLVWDITGMAELGRGEGWELTVEAHDRPDVAS